MLKQIKNGILHGLGILIILGLGGIPYAAFTGFIGLDATTGETLTETKWDNLVDAVKDEYKTDGSEVRTNKLWDGKPVYRKVLYVPYSSTGRKTIEVHPDAELIKVNTRWGQGSSFLDDGQVAGTTLYTDMNYKGTTIRYIYRSSSPYNEVYFIAEYTKTTDTAE